MGIPLESTDDVQRITPSEPVLPNANRVRNTAESRRAAQAARQIKQGGRLSTDSIAYYLSSIARIPLLTAAEEIELAHHVQAMKQLLETPEDERSPRDLSLIHI